MGGSLARSAVSGEESHLFRESSLEGVCFVWAVVHEESVCWEWRYGASDMHESTC